MLREGVRKRAALQRSARPHSNGIRLRRASAARVFERIAGAAVGFGILIGLWWIAAGRMGPTRLPTPAAVAKILFPVLHSSVALSAQGISGGISDGLLYTTQQVLSGVALGSAIGIALGVLMGLNRLANEFLSRLVDVVRTIPPLAAVPFFLIWFGTGPRGQLLLIAFYSAMMVVINARAAVDHLDPLYETYASTLGAGWAQRLRTVILPSMIPELVGGIRVALAFSWGIEVVAELLGAQRGVGHDFVLLTTVLQVDQIIAAIIWISVIAAVIDRLYLLLTSYLTRWVPRSV